LQTELAACSSIFRHYSSSSLDGSLTFAGRIAKLTRTYLGGVSRFGVEVNLSKTARRNLWTPPRWFSYFCRTHCQAYSFFLPPAKASHLLSILLSKVFFCMRADHCDSLFTGLP